jgi:hypothetical protein
MEEDEPDVSKSVDGDAVAEHDGLVIWGFSDDDSEDDVETDQW